MRRTWLAKVGGVVEAIEQRNNASQKLKKMLFEGREAEYVLCLMCFVRQAAQSGRTGPSHMWATVHIPEDVMQALQDDTCPSCVNSLIHWALHFI